MAKDRLEFPLRGKNVAFAANTQPLFTSPHLNNVRPIDTLQGRGRGGKRPAMVKLFTQDIGDGSPVVAIDQITTVEL